MSVLKWAIGIPLSIAVVVVLKLSMPPAPRVQQQEQTSNPSESSFTAPDSSCKSTYIQPKVTGMAEKEKFEYAAKECWKEYERKSLSNLEKQQIAYMCEGMDKRAAEAR